MAITELYSGTRTTDSTRWSCTTDTSGPDADTTDGVFQVFLDIGTGIAAGDILEVRIYEKCRSGDTQQIAYEALLTNTQGSSMWVSPALILMHGWDVTLKATSGGGDVEWSIRQIA